MESRQQFLNRLGNANDLLVPLHEQEQVQVDTPWKWFPQSRLDQPLDCSAMCHQHRVACIQ